MSNNILLSSVEKAFKVLEYIAGKKEGAGVTEVSQALGYSKSSSHRLCATLLNCGYLKQINNGSYKATARMFEVGSKIIQSADFYNISFSFLKALRDRFNETAHMAIFNTDHIVFINKVESQRSLRLYSRVGGEGPAHATALGKVLLAYIPEPELEKILKEKELEKYTETTITDPGKLRQELKKVLEQGYAEDQGEFEEKINCVAAPVKDHTGQTVAALSVSIPNWRSPSKEEVIYEVTKTASDLSRQLGYFDQGF